MAGTTMSDQIKDTSVFQFSRGNRLQWEPTQNKHVILYPEGMVELNTTSAAILELCDGKHSLGEIVGELEEKFSVTGIRSEITGFLSVALEKNWVSLKP
jgi:pyrroloquinoline quinone biosynthesis protein D